MVRTISNALDIDDAFWTAPRVIDAITQNVNGYQSAFEDMTLRSAFQPIVSVSLRQIIGFEGLLRADDQALDAVAACDIFGSATSNGKIVQLDRVAHAIHMNNFVERNTRPGRLFLNMHPGVFDIKARTGNSVVGLAAALGLQAPRIVLEILETPWQGKDFASAADFYRDHGFLLAIDDFCSVQSNLHRVWEIEPDFVKLDRSLTIKACSNDLGYRIVAQIVDMLHQSGAMVIAEGVESLDEALPMIDMDVDYLQGNYFGLPSETCSDDVYENAERRIHQAWNRYPHFKETAHAKLKNSLLPYQRAFSTGAARLHNEKVGLVQAMSDFLGLKGAVRVYSLDQRGVQRFPALVARRNDEGKNSGLCAHNDIGADLSRREYVRRAASRPGQVIVSRPRYSPFHAPSCYTLAIKIHSRNFRGFVCGELASEL